MKSLLFLPFGFPLSLCAIIGIAACSAVNSNVSEIDPYVKVDVGGSNYSGEIGSRIVLRDPASGASHSAPVVPAETVAPTAPVIVVPPTPAASVPVVPASTVPAGTPVAPVPQMLVTPVK